MKVTINHYHAVAVWKWNLNPSTSSTQPTNPSLTDGTDGGELDDEEEEDDDDDDVCGICRVAFDGCCPDCKVPGDACPPSAFPFLPSFPVESTLTKRLGERSLGRMHPRLPYALFDEVVGDGELEAAVSNG